MLNRDDPRLAGPMEAIRKATAARTGDGAAADPVSPGASAEARALLTRLATPGQATLSGQQNDPASPTAATTLIVQATGKQPAIFASNMETAPENQKEIVQQAIHANANHALVALSWHPSRPTDNAPASAHGKLTDFEWNDLLTPGSGLNKLWLEQADKAAESLIELQKAGIAVLWSPLPESNGNDFWWAGRKGVQGSAELYRQLFDRLVKHDGLHNLIWVWDAGAPEFRPGGPGMFSDFFPGYLYTDALQINLREVNPRLRARGMMAQFAAGKPVGIAFAGDPPSPEAFADNSGWSWFVAAPPAASSTDPAARAEALRKLYADPRIVSLAPGP